MYNDDKFIILESGSMVRLSKVDAIRVVPMDGEKYSVEVIVGNYIVVDQLTGYRHIAYDRQRKLVHLTIDAHKE